MLTSVESETEAVQLKFETSDLLQRGGFELAKWRSNYVKLMDGETEAKLVELQENTSVLGISWDFVNDEFQFKMQSSTQPNVVTKRFITSEAAKIFDPQGWLSPVTIRAKLFIQELWRLGRDWDKPLSTAIQQEWKDFYNELTMINEVRIPRWLNTASNQKLQIHIFADASEKAYGVAVYVRTQILGKWKAMLLCSRNKVAPLKIVTIPRLELCAIELSCKLVTKIKDIPMFENKPCFLWTDSEIALHWIRKPSKVLKPFVGNRVSNILKAATPEQIRHVKSKQNPADLLSRGIRVESLLSNELWWQGPPMLSEAIEEWPVWQPKISEDIEKQVTIECKEPPVKIVNTMLTITKANQEIDLISKISSLAKVARITAYVFRFISLSWGLPRKRENGKINEKLKKLLVDPKLSEAKKGNVVLIETKAGQQIQIPRLSVNEIDNAMNYWIIVSQKQSFSAEHNALSHNKTIAKSSRLWTLTPWIDEKGIIRITGRLANTKLPLNQKRPIILDNKSELAKRLVRDAHEDLLHGGTQMCTQYLRNKYWILQSRVLIRSVIHQCVICCRYREEAGHQLMADLPAYRLEPAPAFHHCGVDYAGPFKLKQSRNASTKGYIMVLVCMVYKAVHLELVSGLDSDSCIAALTRFVNLRAGSVKHMYSDNGTNFIGADRALREAVELWEDESVMNYLQTHSIQWHYNPPQAPHHGGLWEAAVKSVKYHLKRISKAQLYTFEEMATILAKISACLNSRQLTPMSMDPTDLTTLSPGHFLTGQAIITPYEALLADIPTNRLSAWQKLQRLQQDFWARWSQEYINEQQRRNKWAIETKTFKVGDLVFIKDEITPACQWLMGRVLEVYTGTDGLIRTCKVRAKKSEFVRPITKLCLLPMDEDQIAISDAGFP